MCARDPCFFVNTFGWTRRSGGDPRFREQPFILYDAQEAYLCELLAASGIVEGVAPHDVLVTKSRQVGVSWTTALAHLWGWLFTAQALYLWGSRSEPYVDKPGEPKSLFWKLVYALDHLPGWLKPAYERTHLRLENLDNGSAITGESANKEFGRGGEFTQLFLDEFAACENGQTVLAATADAGPRLFVSTPKGTGTAFYRQKEHMLRTGEGSVVNIKWWDVPSKARGLYESDREGNVTVLDRGYTFPEDYRFIADGRRRSVWYDAEERRRSSRLEMAQEVDAEDLASGGQFFDADVLQRIEQGDVRPPLVRGELDFNPQTGEPAGFHKCSDGRLLLWVPLEEGAHKRTGQRMLLPPQDTTYVLGSDVAAGTSASNSTCSLVDTATGDKVGEFSSPNIMPHDFAGFACALARWAGGRGGEAFHVWDAGGPGAIFGKVVVEFGCRHVYYHRNQESLGAKPTDRPGFWMATRPKRMAFGLYRAALARGDFIQHSQFAVQEAREYVTLPGDRVAYAPSLAAEDPTGANENHGDRVCADVCAYLGMQEMGRPDRPEEEPEIPHNSFAGRRRQRQQTAREAARFGWL